MCEAKGCFSEHPAAPGSQGRLGRLRSFSEDRGLLLGGQGLLRRIITFFGKFGMLETGGSFSEEPMDSRTGGFSSESPKEFRAGNSSSEGLQVLTVGGDWCRRKPVTNKTGGESGAARSRTATLDPKSSVGDISVPSGTDMTKALFSGMGGLVRQETTRSIVCWMKGPGNGAVVRQTAPLEQKRFSAQGSFSER